MYDALMSALDAGAAVITPTDRLARSIREAYAHHQRESGVTVWATPTVLALPRWQQTLWEATWPEEQPLSPPHELALYKQVLDQSGLGAELLQSSSAARTARRADRLVREYRIDLDDPAYAFEVESSGFRDWMNQVAGTAAEEKLMPLVSVPDVLMGALRQGNEGLAAALPDRVVVYAFPEWTPQTEAFFAALEAAGVTVEHQAPEREAATPSLHRYADERGEAAAIAEWVRQQLRPHRDEPENAPRLGIAVPDVRAARPALDAALRHRVTPQSILPGADTHRLPWRFTQGSTLADQEVIHAALEALQLDEWGNEAARVTRLLLNPRIGDHAEEGPRASLDLRLRERGGRTFSLGHLYRRCQEPETATYAPDLAERLQALETRIQQTPAKLLPSEWMVEFDERLTLLGWPGTQALSSSAHQAQRTFQDSMRVVAGMDRLLGAVDAGRAFGWLREVVSTREHEPQADHYEPVLILSYEEAAGAEFDALWIAGMEASRFPAQAEPNPLLPTNAQREAGVPDASPEAMLERATRQLDMLQRAAPTVIASAPAAQHVDGAILPPSPLLGPWPDPEEAPAADTRLSALIEAPVATTRLTPDEDPVPPMTEADIERLRGGTSVLADYGTMPFFALARRRLGAFEFPRHHYGLDAGTQGNLTHAVLHHVWSRLGDSATLAGLSETALTETVAASVDATLDGGNVIRPSDYGELVIAIERDRLTRLVVEWLTMEAQRPDPFRTVALEAEATAALPGTGFRSTVVLDRIDEVQTADGPRYLLVDYKTSTHLRMASWHPENLTEPQLPLYATYADLSALGVPQVDGIAFGRVVANQCAFLAQTNFTGNLAPDAKGQMGEPITHWEGWLNKWREALITNFESMVLGHAEQDYAELNRSPRYSYLLPLTRPIENIEHSQETTHADA